ncbi:hypothetical protein IFM89_034083 [Coptis chinensis]|uniref:Uncharacterized protein n=1 Tax=Coptis chinensis TaxID=261450 RepID=A0A835I4T0_9MAGN|nr:hypothetical protein IFM89_034083 [Coptis chinensis]
MEFSGILSYGLLNTVYYLATFFFVWFYVAPAPGGMGYAAAVERFLKVMAMVWVGSQVTKLVRAAGALALAPLVSRGLAWFTKKFNFKSEGKASLCGYRGSLSWNCPFDVLYGDIALGVRGTKLDCLGFVAMC